MASPACQRVSLWSNETRQSLALPYLNDFIMARMVHGESMPLTGDHFLGVSGDDIIYRNSPSSRDSKSP